MFSDTEAFAALLVMRAVDEAERRAHAMVVVEELGLDPRLEPFIPLRPLRGKKLRTFTRLLASLSDISALQEPERTRIIEEVVEVVNSQKR